MASSSSGPGLKAEYGSAGDGSEAGMATDQQQIVMYRGLKKVKRDRGCTAKERISKMPPCAAGKRSSIYRGVTRHRWTGRYEAHLWDKSTWNQNQNKKGKQVYLGAYDDEEAAARAYDLAALKYWGPGTLINFPVTDYTRDLEEMQNVSREEYLASLRRKSSGFSRGISKYRGLPSNRWDSSFGRVAGPEYFSNIHYGDDASTESEYIGGFCIDKKIDLTSYIKWWNPNKTRQSDSLTKSEAKHGYCLEEPLEWAVQQTEAYQMPRLGPAYEGKNHKGTKVSALSILSRSAAYKTLQDKVSGKQEESKDNDENENKNNVNKMDYGKAVEKLTSREGAESLGMGGGGHHLPRNLYPLAPLLSAPLLTNYNTIDSLTDPILWASLVPVLPTGLPPTSEVMKTETSSTYNLFRQEE